MSKRIDVTYDFAAGPAKIINLPTPTAGGDAATKAYVDAIPSSLSFIERPVYAASTTNINVSSPGAMIDGSWTLSTGQRVLLAGQTTASQNGIYVFNGSSSALTRDTDSYVTGSTVFVAEGAYSGSGFVLTTTGTITPGTTAMTWINAFHVYSAGTGLTLSGNTISLTVPVTVALGGTGATTAAGALASLGAAIPNSQQFGNGSASSFTFTTFKTIVPYPTVQIVNTSSGAVEDAQVTIVPGSASGGTYAPSITVTSEYWTTNPPGTNAYWVTVVG